MDSKLSTMVPFLCMLLLTLLGSATSDGDTDKDYCTKELLGLSTCLSYVIGNTIVPSSDCCRALKLVLEKENLTCLCFMIKNRNDSRFAFLKINATLAAGLPTTCHTPANVSQCISLLHLPPNSPEAKEFQQLSNITEGRSNAPWLPGGSGNSTEEKSDGGKAKGWIGVLEMACGISVLIFLLQNIF